MTIKSIPLRRNAIVSLMDSQYIQFRRDDLADETFKKEKTEVHKKKAASTFILLYV